MKAFSEFIAEETQESGKFETKEFTIPDHNIEFLEKKIEKLNKTAAKLKCEPIQLIKGEATIIRIPDPEEDVVDHPGYRRDGTPARPTLIPATKVIVKGEAPKLDDWTFIGKREPMDGTESIISKSAPGHKLPKKYADDHDLTCDHCKKRARRSATFVVKKGRKTMEVGRSCLKDFMGHANPEKYADWASALYDVENTLSELQDEDYGGFGRFVPHFQPTAIIAAAIHSIRKTGFVSKQYESDKKMSTAAVLFHHFNPPNPLPRNSKIEDYVLPVDDSDREAAEKVVEWMKTHPQAKRDEFWQNVSKMANAQAIPGKYFGYMAAGANTWLKEQGQIKQQEGLMKTIKKDEGAGKVGDKINVKGTVISSFAYQSNGQWGGVKHIVTVKTDEGHIIKMFTSSGDSGVKKDAKVEISGKIGSVDVEKYDRSPFKGMMVTTMAPRSRIESVLDAETADKHYHIGDKIKFTGADGKGKVGQIVSKPVFGKFEVKSLTQANAATIHVSYEHIIGLM